MTFLLVPPLLALHPKTGIAFAVLLVAAGLSLVLLLAAWAAHRRTREPFLRWLLAAFLVSFAKNAFVAYSLTTDFVLHQDLELYDALGDMAVLLLIALPFLLPAAHPPRDPGRGDPWERGRAE